MQISIRFIITVHVLVCVDVFQGEHKITGDFLTESVNVNAVVIRRIIQQLKSAGRITVTRGSGGASVAKPLENMTFFDVYRAVSYLEDGELFHIHEHPHPNCPVGKNIYLLCIPGDLPSTIRQKTNGAFGADLVIKKNIRQQKDHAKHAPGARICVHRG